MGKEYVMHVHTGILLRHKMKDILPFSTTWVDLEDIMLSEISGARRQILYELIYMWKWKKKKNNQPSELTENRLQIGGCQR